MLEELVNDSRQKLQAKKHELAVLKDRINIKPSDAESAALLKIAEKEANQITNDLEKAIVDHKAATKEAQIAKQRAEQAQNQCRIYLEKHPKYKRVEDAML